MTAPHTNGQPTAEAANLLRYDRALAAAGIGIWEVDGLTGTMVWDDRCRALFGLPAGSPLPYAEAIRFIHDEDRACVDAAFQDALAGKNGGRYEQSYRTIGPDGVLRYVRFTGQTEVDGSGQAVRLTGIAQDVTAAQAAAREQRQKESAIAASGNGIVITGSDKPDSPIVYVNPAFERMTGYTASEIIGQDCRFLQNGDHDQPGIDVVRQAIKKGEAASVVLRNYRKDGSLFYNELTISPVMEDGVLKNFVGIQTDVTERRATIEALRTSEERIRISEDRYQSFVRQSSEGIWRFEIGEPISTDLPPAEQLDRIFSSAYLAECNDAMAQMYGFDNAAELVGVPLAQMMPRNWENIAYLTQFIQSGYRVMNAESHEVDRDGAGRYFMNNLLGIVQDGKLQRAWGTQRDVTEERSTQTALAESEQRFRSIFNGQFLFLAMLDEAGRVLDINELPLRAIGATREEIVGKIFWETAWWHDLPEMRAGWALRLSEAAATDGPVFSEDRFRTADGEVRVADAAVTAVRNKGGEVEFFIVQASDITERKRAEETIRQSEARFRDIIAQAPIATCVFEGSEFRITLANEPMIATMGKGRSVEGKPLIEALPELAGQGFLEILTSVYTTGETFESKGTPVRIVVGGVEETHYFDITFKALRDAAGTVYGILDMSADVTEQVTARRKVEESEAYFRRLTDTVPAIIWITRPDGYCEYLNKHWFKFTGQTREEAEGLGWLDATHPGDKARTSEIFRDANSRRVPFNVLYRLRAADGTYRWAVDSGQPKFSADGIYEGMIGTVVDVHEQQVAQQELKESEATMSAVLDALPVGVVVADATGRLIRDNAANRAIWGVSPETESWEEYGAWVGYWPETGERIAAGEWAMARALQSGEMVRNELVEYEPFDRPGERRAFLNNAAPVRNAEGVIIGGVAAEQDVTDRLRMERDLRESEQRFRALANDTPAFMFSADAEANVEFANRAWLRFGGLEEDSGSGQAWADITHPDDVGPMMEVYSRAVADLKPYQFEIRQKSTTGAWHWILWTGIPRTDAAGVFAGITGVGVDVTEQKTAQQAVEASEQKFRSVIASAPAAMGLFVGRDLVIESPNQTFIDIVGKGWGVVGKPLREAMPELITEGQPFLKILDDVFTTGVPFVSPGSQVKILRGGVMTENFYNITYTPLFDGEGKVYAILDIAIDVTEQIDAQKALEESELFARNLIEHSPVAKGVYVSEDLVIETMNERMLELTGRTADVIGKRWADVTPEFVGTPIEAQLRGVMETGEDVHFPEARVAHIRHGQPYTGWYNYTYKALRDTAGDIYGVMATAVEITESVEARKQIEEQKAFLQNALDIGNLGTFHVDLATRTARYTDNIRQWYGLGALDEPLDQVLQNVVPEDVQMVEDVIARSSSDPQHPHHDFVFRTTDAAGAVQHLRSIGKAVYDDGGRARSISGLIQNVTAQVEGRRKIEEAQRQILASFEQSPVAIALIDEEDLTFRMVNPFYAQLVGRRPEDLVDKPLLEALPQLTGQGFDDLLRSVISTGVAYVNNEMPVQFERGRGLETMYVDLHYQPRRNEDGHVTGVLVIATDVTPGVEARRSVEASEARLRSLIESAPFPIGVYVSEELRIQYANQTIKDIWGKGQDVIGKTYTEVLPELDGSGIYEQLRSVVQTGRAFQARGQRVDLVAAGKPTVFYFNYDFTPLFDTEGNVYAVMNTAADVTAIVQAKQQVEEAETNLRRAVDLAELATFVYDVPGNTFHYSERFKSWLGLREDSIETRPAYDIFLTDADRERVERTIGAALQPGSGGLYDCEHPIRNSVTGQVRIIHAQGQVAFDADGNPLTLSGAAQDVTKERALQAELERQVRERTQELDTANKNLTRSNEELSQYAYVASHDLQEPLRKIQMFSSILEKQKDLPESAPPVISRISQAAERMSGLIQSLLEFSRLLNSDPMKRPVDLNQVVGEIVRDFELVVAEKGAKISVGELPTTEAVALQMNQLFYNLMGNALKFSKPGEAPDIRVESHAASAQIIAARLPTATPEESYCHLTVSDNGIGFETRYADQIFEVFKRLHTRDVYPGSGIGLALCRRIVEGHGGTLWADSTPGEGTTFNILLPSAKAEFISAFPEHYIHTDHNTTNQNQAWR